MVRPRETFTPMAAIFSVGGHPPSRSTAPDAVETQTPVRPFSTPAETPRSARAAISTASRRRTYRTTSRSPSRHSGSVRIG